MRLLPGTSLAVLASYLTLSGFLSAGCASGSAPDTAAPASAAGHAPSSVVPGSYEDWCGEHAVPESVCTKCNPALIAAFKATGDWCTEHGLPESHCKLCTPGLVIERPPAGAPSKGK